MGVTYKGFDVDLRCLVTLKVISEQYLGDESARLRFLREARAAAKVRHSNVASVLHLGRTIGDFGGHQLLSWAFFCSASGWRYSIRSRSVSQWEPRARGATPQVRAQQWLATWPSYVILVLLGSFADKVGLRLAH